MNKNVVIEMNKNQKNLLQNCNSQKMKGANSMIKSTTERGITKVAFEGTGTVLDYDFKAIVASMVEKALTHL